MIPGAMMSPCSPRGRSAALDRERADGAEKRAEERRGERLGREGDRTLVALARPSREIADDSAGDPRGEPRGGGVRVRQITQDVPAVVEAPGVLTVLGERHDAHGEGGVLVVERDPRRGAQDRACGDRGDGRLVDGDAVVVGTGRERARPLHDLRHVEAARRVHPAEQAWRHRRAPEDVRLVLAEASDRDGVRRGALERPCVELVGRDESGARRSGRGNEGGSFVRLDLAEVALSILAEAGALCPVDLGLGRSGGSGAVEELLGALVEVGGGARGADGSIVMSGPTSTSQESHGPPASTLAGAPSRSPEPRSQRKSLLTASTVERTSKAIPRCSPRRSAALPVLDGPARSVPNMNSPFASACPEGRPG